MMKVQRTPNTFEAELDKARNNLQNQNKRNYSVDDYYNEIMDILSSAYMNLTTTQYQSLISRLKKELWWGEMIWV